MALVDTAAMRVDANRPAVDVACFFYRSYDVSGGRINYEGLGSLH